MKGRWVALSLAAAGLLMASSVFDTADARRSGGGGPGSGGHYRAGGGGHAIGMRSMSRPSTSMRSMGSRPMGTRQGSVYAGGHIYRSGRGPRHAHRHHRHRYVAIPLGLYAGYGYYDYYNAYGDGCEWLRQQALYTGSLYWWDRYNACTRDYGY